jgi:hypothetical protein
MVRSPIAPVLALAVATCLAACGGAGSRDGAAPIYEGDGTVLDEGGSPQLCLGGVADSLPPQCDGVPIEGWTWDAVEGEETVGDVSWGDYHVVGTYDGETIHLDRAEPVRPADDRGDPFAAPCDEPDGGWLTPDPGLADDGDVVAAMRVVEPIRGYAGLWIDRIGPRPHGGTAPVVLVVAFTDAPASHEAAIREVWGGPLCLAAVRYSYRELRQAQRELGDGAATEAGLDMLWSSVNVTENRVELGTVVADDADQARMDRRYGPGLVDLQPALTPVA